jgi:hypothetical protein
MSTSKNIKSITLILISFVVSLSAYGQFFKPDKDGYIADPLFHKAIKIKGYQLVGAFDTVSINPPLMAGFGINNRKLLSIGLDANVTIRTRPTPFIPNNVGSSGNTDIIISASSKVSESVYETAFIAGKYGTINKVTKKIGLPAIYDRFSYQLNGYIEISLDGNVGLAKPDGTIIVSPRYKNINQIASTKSVLYTFWINNKYGVLDSAGKEIIKPEYDQIYACYECDRSKNLLVLRSEKKIGLANKSGKIILPPTYEMISGMFGGSILRVKQGVYYGLIDSLGKVVLETKYSRIEPNFRDNVFRVSIGISQISYGLADEKGKLLVEPIYNYIDNFEGGYAQVRLNGKTGLINKSGRLIVKPDYEYVLPQSAGIVAAKDDKIGLINFKGEVIIPFTYDKMYSTGRNLFYQKGTDFGIMNNVGKLIQKLNYDDVVFTGKYYIVKKEGKFGVLGINLNTIFPIKYDAFKNVDRGFLSEGIATVMLDDVLYVIDRYGNQIPKDEFEAIREDRPIPRSAEAIKAHNENVIYTPFGVDFGASFKKGVKFEQYIRENLIISEKLKSYKGNIQVNYVVEKDGSIKEVKYSNQWCIECQAELTRVIKSSPNWKPATKDGKPVRVSYTLNFVWNKPPTP